jgi:hypothetical protein
MSDSSATAEQPQRQVRWRWVAWRAGSIAILLAGVTAWLALVPWIPFFPQPLGRHLTEWFLRGLLVGYAATLLSASLGALGLAVYVLRGRQRHVRRPIAARLWLLCASSLISLGGVELAATVWLAWLHRLPALPMRLAEPPPGETSIVVIGESSARGYPYQPWLSVGQIVAWQLEKTLPGRRFRVDVRARVGANLEEMHQDLAKLTRRPDVLIVYCGHNEYLTRYDSARDAGLQEAPLDPILDRFYQLSLASPCCRLIYETVSKHRLGGPPPPLHQHYLIDPPCMTQSESAAIVADFQRRLDAIVGYSERIGCTAVLLIPPGNEGGFEPNRSVLADTVSKAESVALTRAFETARATEARDPAEALAGYRAILKRHPEFAEAHLRTGRLLEDSGDYAEANWHYILARDSDGYPVRCPGPLQEAYRTVARRHGSILIDGPAVLRRICPHGILDDHAFHDGHHPALAGHVALAQAVLEALRARSAFRGSQGLAPTIDLAETARHFGIDTEKWVVVCARAATFYRDFTWTRHDRTERRAKQRRYEEAGREIANGVAPEATGVPGLGVAVPGHP